MRIDADGRRTAGRFVNREFRPLRVRAGALMRLPLDRRPLIVAIAGPNGAGKSTFYELHLAAAGLPFVNADVIAREMSDRRLRGGQHGGVSA